MTTTTDLLLGYNTNGGSVLESAEHGFTYSLTTCCGAAVSGSDHARCKACHQPANDDTNVALVAFCGTCGELSGTEYWKPGVCQPAA